MRRQMGDLHTRCLFGVAARSLLKAVSSFLYKLFVALLSLLSIPTYLSSPGPVPGMALVANGKKRAPTS